MSRQRKRFWLAGIVMVAAAMACMGPMGCSGDDDDDDGGGGGTSVVVVTNETTGVVVTNIVVVPETPPPGASVLNVAGTWIGNFQTDGGEGQLALYLTQSDLAIFGTFAMNTGGADNTGDVAGSIDGDHLTVMLIDGGGNWMELDGYVNAGATDYNGNLTGDWGQGQFALDK